MIRRTFLSIAAAAASVALLLGTAPDAHAKQPTPANNIVDVAIAVNSSGPFAGQFDTLIAAVKAADPAVAAVLAADPAVLQRLTSKGQSTVFAPTDDAFAKLNLTPENVGGLDKAFLTDVLLYHVVTGRRDSGQVLASERLRTLQGAILRQAGGVLTDSVGRTSVIIVTDVGASNGVIHAIDTVVLPYAP
jgi:uncharacterized surface protein with fasciclin (FAS1) repeats